MHQGNPTLMGHRPRSAKFSIGSCRHTATFIFYLFIYLLLRQIAARHTGIHTVIFTGIQSIKNIRNTEMIWRKSQVHRDGKWVPNQFSDRVVWQFRRQHIIQTTVTKVWCTRRDNDCRTTESEQYNVLQNSNLSWCNKYNILSNSTRKYISSK